MSKKAKAFPEEKKCANLTSGIQIVTCDFNVETAGGGVVK